MALASYKKIDLVNLAKELDLQVTGNEGVKKIIKMIEEDPSYDKDLTINLIKTISKERIEQEAKAEKKRELERAEKERDLERERAEKERDLERERAEREREKAEKERELERERAERERELERERQEAERRERQELREFELQKLQLERETETASLSSTRTVKSPQISLKDIMGKFDENKSDISLFLNLFQRQAEKAGIEESNYTAHLIPLLPANIAEIVLRESNEHFDDFEYIKNLLLRRFRLSAENLRLKFVTQQKNHNALWKDLCFDLSNFLEGWLEGLKITDFESLKNLMITDQIKRRASAEAKDHFIDSWADFKDPHLLAEKLDNFDLVRKKPLRNFWNSNKFEKKERIGNNYSEEKIPDQTRGAESRSTRAKTPEIPNWRDKTEKERTKAFEKREARKCFLCGSISHLKSECKLNKNSNKTGSVNFVNTPSDFEASFGPYLSEGLVNGKKITLLRDSGTSIDILGFNFINKSDLNGEHIWLKQPLDASVKCLPLADITLETPEGTVFTKAAVVDKDVNMQHYLLGNETQKLLELAKSKPKVINAITRSMKKNCVIPSHSQEPPVDADSEVNNITLEEDNQEETLPSGIDINPASIDNEDSIVILPPSEKDCISTLASIGNEEFKVEQKNDQELSALWKKAEQGKSKLKIDNDLLFRITTDHVGNERKQLVIPTKFRDALLHNSHKGIAAHLGATKSKDRLLRYFFWPNAIKDMENFVKECDPCQRIGKACEKKKAPLKLVPIISEIFSHLSVDITGPLPKSENNNKYLLTALCVASKYPEAIPMPDIKSETVIDALMQIFSRLGFARSIKTDLGRSFVSALTSTFCDKFGVKIIHSSVARPESNVIERWHRTVKRLLKVMCIESKTSWEKNLPYALLALRSVPHESTGFSPAELVHGKNLRTPETILFENWTNKESENNIVTEYVFELVNRLKRCQEIAKSNMENSQVKRKLWFDKNAVVRKFKEGDKVLVLATAKPNKFSVSWIGPGTIVRQISETNYIVNLPGRREKEQIFHVNLLKPYFGRTNLVNILIAEKWDPKLQDADLDIIYPDSNPEIFDFNEIVRNSNLEKHCTLEQIQKLQDLLGNFRDVFSNDPGKTDWITHDIELLEEKPIRLRPYRTSPRQNEILRKEIKRMLELGIIVEGESDYTSPMILVEAPGKDPRPCIDYRKLNAITRVEYFPLPNIEERVEQVAKAKYISVIDLTKGYWQIPLTPRAQRLAAFITTFGTYLPKFLPFGLLNASFKFSKFMSMLLRGFESFCIPYLDDMAIFSDTWEDHVLHLEKVLTRIREANLKIKLAKCQFACKTVKYLGHMVGNGIRTPAQAKIQSILNFPTPKNKTEIRQILGLAGYYSRYLQNYATLVEPLTRALKGKTKKETITWTAEMEEAFSKLKLKLTSHPVLFAPDFEKEFIVQTDASDKGIGVVLAQRTGNEEHPVLYLSRKFTSAELNYATTEKECAAIIYAIKKLRLYLDGQKFRLETDHDPLRWLKNNASANQRLMRWALTLQPYNFEISHRPGKLIPHVDCLSRM